jgi:hypothetical protein
LPHGDPPFATVPAARRCSADAGWKRPLLTQRFAEDGEAVSGSVFANVVESAGKAAAIGFDVGILRTLGSIRVVVGAVALIPTSIIYLLKMPIDGDEGALLDVVDILVVEPAEFVFRRPLGEDFAGG